jgi:hypothetical protein
MIITHFRTSWAIDSLSDASVFLRAGPAHQCHVAARHVLHEQRIPRRRARLSEHAAATAATTAASTAAAAAAATATAATAATAAATAATASVERRHDADSVHADEHVERAHERLVGRAAVAARAILLEPIPDVMMNDERKQERL